MVPEERVFVIYSLVTPLNLNKSWLLIIPILFEVVDPIDNLLGPPFIVELEDTCFA